MIKIVDITNKPMDLLLPGDIKLCLTTAEIYKNESINVLVHDAYRINLLKVKSGYRLLVKVGNKTETLEFDELFKKVVRVYNTTITKDLSHLLYNYSNNSYRDDKSKIVVIPQQIFDIATKLGMDRETFVNEYVYTNVVSICKTLDVLDIKQELKSITDKIYYDASLTAKSPMSYYVYGNSLSTNAIIALLYDTYVLLVNTRSRYTANKMCDNEFIHRTIDTILKSAYNYVFEGSKDGLRALYTYLNNNIESFGLPMFLVINQIEEILNKSYGVPPYEQRSINNIAEVRSFFESTFKPLSGEAFSEAVLNSNINVPSQAFGYHISEPANPNINITPIEPSLITPLIDETQSDDINVPRLEEQPYEQDTNALQQLHFRKYMDKFMDYKNVRTFDNPVERQDMVRSLLRLAIDIDNTKMSYTRGDMLENSPKSELGIYDVLVSQIHEHIDYLNSIKFYGDDEVIAQLNEDKYYGTGSGEKVYMFGKDKARKKKSK